jgi:ABC-type nitrate/sulfonate/bicarbonate transport system substrate-binding protein
VGVFADRIRTLFCALALRFPDATLDQVKTFLSCIAAAIAIYTASITLGAEGTPERIRILYASTALSFSPIWIASDLGIYRKHGLDAEAILLGGGPLIASVLLSGSADIGIGAGDAPIRVALQGGDMKIFALQKHARILSIVSKPSIQELSQIKVLGVQSLGSSTHNYWLWYARQRKLAEQQVQFVHTSSSAENFLALKSGRVDAGVFGPPFDVQAEREGFRLLVEGVKNPQPFPATAYFATAAFLAKRPEGARRFIEAMKEAVQIFREDKASAFKVIARRLKVSQPSVLERAYEYERPFMRRDLSLQLEVIENALVESKRALGASAKRPDLTVDDAIDRSFVGVAR